MFYSSSVNFIAKDIDTVKYYNLGVNSHTSQIPFDIGLMSVSSSPLDADPCYPTLGKC